MHVELIHPTKNEQKIGEGLEVLCVSCIIWEVAKAQVYILL